MDCYTETEEQVGTLVSYEFEDPVATIRMDDGKVNVLSFQMFAELNAALDEAVAQRAVVALVGRQGIFSAGFDLSVLRAGGPDATAMLRAGFDLAQKVLSFPTPVVIACPGHAVAMGVFLLLSGDYRIGARGPFKITANEVAIGFTMPRAAVEICRARLTPSHLYRAVALAEVFAPDDAAAAGFLDRVVDPSELDTVAATVAADLAKLDLEAHAASKARVRECALKAIRAGIEADDAAYRAST
jgi:enoyl-CoA hydratase